MRIGSYELKNRILLAPMAGITDQPFRRLCAHYGAGLTFSEMMSTNPQVWHTEKSKLRLVHSEDLGLNAVQIAGSDPLEMAQAAAINVAYGAEIIDINMGCPAKKVNRKLAGSALLQFPDLVERILKEVVNAGDVPVPACNEPTGKKVAIIGGGPGGLSAAYYLALMGHKVTIFEQRKQLGGMLRYGIPNYRLPRKKLDAEINAILSTGIEVKKNISVGTDITLEDINKEYNAVYISIGAHADKKIGIDGEDATTGVTSAVEMLRAIGDDEMPDYTGKRVVVIGGGNVAMDVARSSVRLGAEKVSIVYRRRKADMTALPEEVEGAEAEGCDVLELMSPVRIEKDENDAAVGLWVQPQMISRIKGGRPSPKTAAKDEVLIPCDLIVVAIGQGIETRYFEEHGVTVKRGTIEALDTSEIKERKGIFAGGDCVTGPATVIRAIAAGKVAAANIDEYLGYHHEITSDVEIPYAGYEDKVPCGRVEVALRDAADRKKDFEPIEYGFSCEEACQESGRCLRCDHFGFGSFRGGREKQW